MTLQFTFNLPINFTLLTGVLAALTPSPQALASCGSAFCTINTNWNLQGAAIEPGWRLDLRTEYIDQDQPRSGNDDISVGEIKRHHDELKTRNRNAQAVIDYTMNEHLGFSATIPVTDRDHLHIHNHHGAKIPESWDFTRLGDIRVQGRYQWSMAGQENAGMGNFGLNLGVKLPTGQTHVDNADGDRAERGLQPGTGTTDILLGAYYNQPLSSMNSSWFVQGVWQQPLNRHEHFESGHRFSADLGYHYELTPKTGLIAQINTLIVARDRGTEAEPEDTGGQYVYFSPGATFAVTPDTQVYGFVQKPVYQYVNGVQLTADWSAVAGLSIRF